MIVHDIRNPHTGIDGYLQLVQMTPDDPELVLRAVERALEAARQLRGLLECVLEVRLLEEGAVARRREKVPVAEVDRDAVDTLDAAGEMGRVPLQRSVPAELAASLDRKLVCRALENLFANALKYSPRGNA